jgi:hypothetical protein
MRNWVEKLRGWLAASGSRISTTAYLPQGLIGTALILAYTDLCVVLFAQPAIYWVGKGKAENSLPALKALLDSGVWAYALAGLAYLILIWLALNILPRAAALVLWMPVSYVHLSHTLLWLAGEFLFKHQNPVPGYVIAGCNAVSALASGVILSAVLLRPAPKVSPRRFVRWLRPAVSVIWALALVAALTVQAVSYHSGWQPVVTAHSPGKRAYSNIVYDSKRQVFVLFGGISEWLGSAHQYMNDTWEWDGTDWKEIKTKTVPTLRCSYSMAYDEKRGVVVMFGGQAKDEVNMFNDTWIYDGVDWKMMQSGYTPQARRDAQMFFDPATEKIILSGGFYKTDPEKEVKQLQDAWEWDGEKWSEGRASTEKVTITTQTTAWDTINNREMMFNYNSVLGWVDGKWAKMKYDNFPPSRWAARLASDPNTGDVLLFGGVEGGALNDTWVLSGNAWRELYPPLKPDGRDSHLLFYDPERASFVMYGGWSGGLALDDMWEYVIPE